MVSENGRDRRKVCFAGVQEPGPVAKSWPKGALRASLPDPPRPAESSCLIASVYAGYTQLDAHNTGSILVSLLSYISMGDYASRSEIVVNSGKTQTPPSCLEAYAVLNSALRSGKISQQLLNNINSLMESCRRDFGLYKDAPSILDLRVGVQILRVVDYLLFNDETAPIIHLEHIRYFFTEAIRAVRDSSSSKSLVGICIHLFGNTHIQHALTTDIARQLLVSMSERSNFASTAVTSEYLATFRMLLQHFRSMMAANAKLWTHVVMQSLLEPSSFVRQQALHMLSEINRKQACNVQIAQAVHDVLDDTNPEGEPLAAMLGKKLITFLGIQGEAKWAMAAWANIMLILSNCGTAEKLFNWKHLGRWLDVARVGLKSPYLSTKEAAINSWKTTIYVFAAEGDQTRHEKLIKALLHPLKLVNTNSPGITRRLGFMFNALLYVSTGVLSQPLSYFDGVWSTVIASGLDMFFSSKNDIAKEEAIRYLSYMMHPAPTKATTRAKILQTDIELTEVSPLPLTWIKQNFMTVLDFFSRIFAACTPEQISTVWNSFLDISRQSLKTELLQSSENLGQLAALTTFLLQNGKSMDPAVLVGLVTNLCDAFGLIALVNQKFDRVGDLVVVATPGSTSILAQLFPVVVNSSVPAALLEQLLGTLVPLSGTSKPREYLQTLRLASSFVEEKANWALCQERTLALLESTSQKLTGALVDDLGHILGSLLSYVQPGEVDMWHEWQSLFSMSMDKSSSYVPLVDALDRAWPAALVTSLLELKTTTLSSVNDFDKIIFQNTVKNAEFHCMTFDFSALPQDFRVELARQLVLVNLSTTLFDFGRILLLSYELLGVGNIVSNADIYVAALRSHVPGNKALAAKFWDDHYCVDTQVADTFAFSEQVVYAVNSLMADGVIAKTPPSFPVYQLLQAPTLKKFEDCALSPPPTSPMEFPPSSPAEALSQRKRRRVDYMDRDCMTPPISSDEPGVYAMELLNQIHSTDDASVIETISEKSSQFVKPEPVREMEALESSPPRSLDSKGTPDKQLEQVRSLKKSLMATDLQASLKNMARAECLLLEKLLMDSLVDLRIHMANA